MKKLIGSLVAVAGMAAAAQAQLGTTVLDLQVSADGQTWSDEVSVAPGATVLFRARVSLTGASALGFSGINFQPTLSNWDNVGAAPNIDQLLAFADVGSNSTTPAGSVDGSDAPGLAAPLGRIRPFGAPNVTTTNRMRGHLDSGGTIMRVAQNGTTNAIGVGASSNNVNGSGGIPVSQSTGLFAPPGTFVFGTTNIAVVKLGIRVSDDVPVADRILQLDAPTGGISLYGPNGDVRAGNWLTGHDPDTGAPINNYAPIAVDGARIRVLIPAPGALALLGLGGLAVTRRRR